MSTVKSSYATIAAFTLTLASLASSTSGVGRQSTLVDNTTNLYLAAQISLRLKMGTSPTANSLIYVYLIRSNNDTPIIDDEGGASDAGITIVNAVPLGTILCSASTTGAFYDGFFDTQALGIDLGPKWGIAVVNSTGVAFDATEGNHLKKWIGITKTVA